MNFNPIPTLKSILSQLQGGIQLKNNAGTPVLINPATDDTLTNGNQKTQILPQISTPQTLQNAATANGNGTPVAIGNYGSMLINIDPASTITAATITFQVQGPDNNWYNVLGTRITDLASANNTTTAVVSNNESWIIPVAGNQNIRTVISNYAGSGAITVSGVFFVERVPSSLAQMVNYLATIAAGTSSGRIHNSVRIVNNTTITATVTSSDIDFSKYSGFEVTAVLGAGSGGTPTAVVSLQIKDSNGDYITDSNNVSTTLSASTSNTAVIADNGRNFGTCRVVVTLGGTGTFTASEIDLELKS